MGGILGCFLEVSFRKYWHFLVQSSDCKSICFSGLIFFLGWKSTKLIINLKHTITSLLKTFSAHSPKSLVVGLNRIDELLKKGLQETRAFSLGHLGAFSLKSAASGQTQRGRVGESTPSKIPLRVQLFSSESCLR